VAFIADLLSLPATGRHPLPNLRPQRKIVDQIADRTDGVPLFIEELTKSVLESGVPLMGIPATARLADGATRPIRVRGTGGTDRRCNRARVQH
jgi:hypothetical protein